MSVAPVSLVIYPRPRESPRAPSQPRLAGSPSAPAEQEEEAPYRYRLFEADGTDAGEAHYATMVETGELIFTGDGRKLRVFDVMPFDEEDQSPFYAAIRVEAIGTAPRQPPKA